MKTYLDTHLCKDKDEVKAYLERTVQELSPLAKRGSLLFNAALLKACSSGESFNLGVEELQTLIYQTCRYGDSKVKAAKDFTKWVKAAYNDAPGAYDTMLPTEDPVNGTYFKQILTTYAVQYRTNFLNHLTVHFDRRIGSYVKGVWAIKEPTFKWPKGGVSKAIQLLVKGAVKQETAKEALPDHIVDWVWLERSQLTKDETVELDTDWIQENLVPTIKFYHRVLTFWDSVKTEHSNQIRQKPFTLAPTHQTRRLFVNLDNTAFYLLLKALNKVPERPPMVNGLKELQDKLRKEKLEAQAKEKKEWEEAFKKDNGRDPEEKDYPRDLLVKKRVKLKKEDIEKIGEDALDDEMYFKIV
jgi:hypothetical protein